MENNLVITPLGGLGEIGLNCQLWECDSQVIMIDCGLMFPQNDHLGIDVLIPHFGAVRAVKEKLKGIILTHGHEDHIGALPWILPELKGTHIYGSRFTLELVRHKLEEHKLLNSVGLHPVDKNTILELGKLKFHFFPVCHSIPHGFALGIETPIGKVIHSGDFKIDPHPLEGTGTELELFQNFAGPQGARLLLSDSTNVLRQGHSLTEREVKESLEKIFNAAKGRIIVTLFSSHIQRIQEVFDLAEKYDRSVIISGKSLATNIDIAAYLGNMRFPPSFHNAYNGVPDIPPEKTVLLVTGAQGEPLSALSRMVWQAHRQLSIGKGDTVIMSSRVIPGNTLAINKLINEMYRLGAEVYYESSHAVHASGHAQRDELKELIQAVKPEIFVPIHGEYQHLVAHGRLAQETGIRSENIIIIENGEPLVITEESHYKKEPLPVEYTLVDGKGVGDVDTHILKERKVLGDEGMVVVEVIIDRATNKLVHGPEMISRGFVYSGQFSHILEDAKCLVLDEIEAVNKQDKGLNNHEVPKGISARENLEDNIKVSLRKFFKRILERQPMIIPIVHFIN